MEKQFIIIGQSNSYFGIKLSIRQINNFISLDEFKPDIKNKGIKIGLFVEQTKKSEFEKEESLLIFSIEVK